MVLIIGFLSVPLSLAEDQPPASQTFEQVLAQSEGEALTRMLIERKARRAALAANGADPRLRELDGQIAAIHEKLAQQSVAIARAQSRWEEPSATVNYFPRIVPATVPPPVAGPVAVADAAAAVAAPQSAAAVATPAVPPDPLDSPQDQAAWTRMEGAVTLVVHDMPLGEAFAQLEAQCKVPIRPNWRALQAAGVDREAKVSAELREVAAGRVLTTLLNEVGGGTANLGYTVEDGGATVSTRDDLNSARYQVVRVYDVEDLLARPGQAYAHVPAQVIAELRSIQVTNLTDTIKAVVSPDTWRDNGGTIGSVRELNGLLVVMQTKDNHRELEHLLALLRMRR
jgi:hypothetical protein